VSTKMYHAYRIPYSRLMDFTELFDGLMLDMVEKHLDHVIDCFAPPELKPGWEKAVRAGTLKEAAAPFMATSVAFLAAILSSKRGVAYGNLDASFNAWPYKRRWYIQPIFASVGRPPDIPALAPYVEEYGYWNNTDQPEHVTDRQWRARRDTWEKICLSTSAAWHTRRFTHLTIDGKLPWLIGFDELERRVSEKHPWPECRLGSAAWRASMLFHTAEEKTSDRSEKGNARAAEGE